MLATEQEDQRTSLPSPVPDRDIQDLADSASSCEMLRRERVRPRKQRCDDSSERSENSPADSVEACGSQHNYQGAISDAVRYGPRYSFARNGTEGTFFG